MYDGVIHQTFGNRKHSSEAELIHFGFGQNGFGVQTFLTETDV